MSTKDALTVFAERLGHRFGDAALLERALCHRSWCSEHPGHESNERLEFLGDAVLGMIVADHVYQTFPGHDEGWLSRARSSVVRASALAEMAMDLALGDILRLGKGEDASGGREKVSILADSLEAVIAAVYIDGGWDAVCAVVTRLIADRVATLRGGNGEQDDKSRLQELVARRFDRPPLYEVDEEGPEHDKRFFARALVDDAIVGEGTGRSKKQAEQAAARAAWQQLDAETVLDGSAVDAAPADPAPGAPIAPPRSRHPRTSRSGTNE